MTDDPRNTLSYDSAMHGMQSGVAMELERDPTPGTPKHLRVGINSALVNDAALARLLIKKGIISIDEYDEEVRLEANRELDRHEDRLSHVFGRSITLR